MASIRQSMGEIPIVESEEKLRDSMDSPKEGIVSTAGNKGPKILADGTYATESSYVSKSPTSPIFDHHRKSSIRGMLRQDST